MGKLSNLYPQTRGAYYQDEEDSKESARIKEQDLLLKRQENFELHLLKIKLDAFDKLSNSILALAESLQNQNPVTNVYIVGGGNSDIISNNISKLDTVFI